MCNDVQKDRVVQWVILSRYAPTQKEQNKKTDNCNDKKEIKDGRVFAGLLCK